MDLVPTDAEVAEAERIYKTAYDADFGRGYGMRRALESFLQGRAKLAQETSISNIQIIADPSIPKGEAVFRQGGKEVGRITNIGNAQKPAQEEITDAERYQHIRSLCQAMRDGNDQWFVIPHIDRLPEQDLMRGSVAQHLDKAVNVAIRASKGEKT